MAGCTNEEVEMDEDVLVVSRWWSFLLRGIIAIAVGLILLFWTGATVKVLAYVVGIFALLDGLVNVILSIMKAVDKERWVWTLVWGLIGLLLGGLIISRPGAVLGVIVILAGLWVILMGVIFLAFSFDMPPDSGRGWIGILGFLIIVVGILILAYPAGSVYAVAVLIAIYALIKGVFEIIIAFRVRSIGKKIEKAAGI
jgi:uncharacterized membrane protein HdeD (DUF308 family)